MEQELQRNEQIINSNCVLVPLTTDHDIVQRDETNSKDESEPTDIESETTPNDIEIDVETSVNEYGIVINDSRIF